MKKILILLILSVPGSFSFAQQYQPFPASNARWLEHSEIIMYYVDQYHCYDTQYDIVGDTVVNSVTYHKLWCSVVNYQWGGLAGCTGIFQSFYSYYAGSFREDFANKKVFFLKADSSNESLLYNFNLSLGDTVPELMINNNPGIINRVTKVDSVLLNGSYHKMFYLSVDSGSTIYWGMQFTPNYVALIEGIGNTYGLLYNLCPPYGEAIVTQYLKCVSENGIAVYPAGASVCLSVGIEPREKEKNPVEIFPNPAEDVIHLRLGSDLQKPATFKLFNLMGQAILTRQANADETDIDLQFLPPGIYIYQLESRNTRLNGKIARIK